MAEPLELASVYETDRVLNSTPLSVSVEVQYHGLGCLGTRYKALGPLQPQQLAQVLQQQLDTLSRVRHPNIVQFLGLHSSAPDLPLIVHELLPKCLTQCLDHPLPLRHSLSILHDVALALNCLHHQAIVHGSISAANIYLTKDMTAKLFEVGTAFVLRAVQCDYLQPTTVTDIRSFGTVMQTVLNSTEDISTASVKELVYSVVTRCLQADPLDTITLLSSIASILSKLPSRDVSSPLEALLNRHHNNFVSVDSAIDPDPPPGLTPYSDEENPPLLNRQYSISQLQDGFVEWRRCADLPVAVFQAEATLINGRVYVGGGNTESESTANIIYEYDPCSDNWRGLPPVNVTLFGLGQLEGELVIVGGRSGVRVSDLVLVFNHLTQRWKLSLPPLITPRYSTTCLCPEGALIVSGGLSQAGQVANSIEVLAVDQFTWTVVGYLSRSASLCYPSATRVADSFYLLGGYTSDTACSVSSSSHCAALSTLLPSGDLNPYIWHGLPDTPHKQATAATLHGYLLSLGGCTQPYTKPVHNSIHAFSPSLNSWELVGTLPHAVCHATAVAMGDEILLIGGWVEPGKFKRSNAIYRGQFVMQR